MASKINRLRDELKKLKIDGFFIPHADEFQGEYLPESAERLEFISGFTGSSGNAVILADKAGFFTDGRYTLQSTQEVDDKLFQICNISADQGDIPTIKPEEWVKLNLKKGDILGFDPWLHTISQIKALEKAVSDIGATLKAVDYNPIDKIWDGQPEAPKTKTVKHPIEYAGQESADKRANLGKDIKTNSADAFVITMPEDIAWLLNIRGNDVPHTPLALSFAIANSDGSVDLYIDAEKLDQDLDKWLGQDVRIHPFEDFENGLKSLSNKNVLIDPKFSAFKVKQALENSNIIEIDSPCQIAKAVKNDVEIQGTINAHIRDGVALTRFLFQMSKREITRRNTELSATKILLDFRAEENKFKDLSFRTISGAGSNGAVVHYSVDEKSSKDLTSGPIYLVDSGGQYLDGTTDVTRTIAINKPSQEMIDNFTLVLKGHIQVVLSEFEEGETGDNLDAKARKALIDNGLNYSHGTGHGVGSYLSVHEGPQGIHPMAKKTAFKPGMIVSNEPGYYKNGEYGIRIENLIYVIDTGKKSENGKKILGFKNLTMAPIDKNLINPKLLDDAELEYLNKYHQDVQNKIGDRLDKKDPDAGKWLKQATKPISKPSI